jgi:antitoxin ParD1/3/4
MNISVPDKMKEWIEGRVADGSFASSSDYVRDLVRQDQREQQKLERLRAEIERGRASGVSETDPFDLLEELRQRAQAASRDAA